MTDRVNPVERLTEAYAQGWETASNFETLPPLYMITDDTAVALFTVLGNIAGMLAAMGRTYEQRSWQGTDVTRDELVDQAQRMYNRIYPAGSIE